MINIFEIEVIDATSQEQPGWYDSSLSGTLLEIQISSEDRRVLNEFFDGTLRQRFGITDYSHLILRVSNNENKFGLKIVDHTMWIAHQATIEH